MMHAGELNRQITFYIKENGENELLQTTKNDKKFKTVWAKIQPQTNKAYKASADTLASEITHKITIRYRKDIKKDMHIIYQGRRFDIKAQPLDPYMDHKWLEIMVEEVSE